MFLKLFLLSVTTKTITGDDIYNITFSQELIFCTQTDAISLRPEITNRSLQNCNLKSHLWGGRTTRILPTGNQIAVNKGLASTNSSLDIGCWPNSVTCLYGFFFFFNDCIFKLGQITFYKKTEFVYLW